MYAHVVFLRLALGFAYSPGGYAHLQPEAEGRLRASPRQGLGVMVRDYLFADCGGLANSQQVRITKISNFVRLSPQSIKNPFVIRDAPRKVYMVRGARLQKTTAPMQTDSSIRSLQRNIPDYRRPSHWCAPVKRGTPKICFPTHPSS